jgi:hypothetical protein
MGEHVYGLYGCHTVVGVEVMKVAGLGGRVA